jgi:hypothetical protein
MIEASSLALVNSYEGSRAASVASRTHRSRLKGSIWTQRRQPGKIARMSSDKRLAGKRPAPKPKAKARPKAKTQVKLLTGGNPQIAKGEGDASVQAYIAAMPEWKSDLGRRLDRIIQRAVPGVSKAVKWNSAFYGVEGQGWFLNFACCTKYVKVAFFKGSSLSPLPPGESKHKEVRYLDIYEGELDEPQFAKWVKQASLIPGWMSSGSK